MMKNLGLALCIAGLFAACGERAEDAVVMRSFGDAVSFLRSHQEVIVLGEGNAQVAVVPGWQGRVMTSTNGGTAGPSFGWINEELIRSGEILPHINVFGGEDRFWMGPEGGQFAIFFKPGDPFDLEHWQTPAAIDTEPFETVEVSAKSAAFSREIKLTNYSGTPFSVRIVRTIRLLPAGEVNDFLGELPAGSVQVVAFESENRLANIGAEAWTREGGLLSIWILGMFNPSPRTTVVIPYVEGSEEELGPVVNDSYFGKVPPDRLRILERVLLFRADGQYRSKIGLSPARALDRAGSWDAEHQVLTLVRYNKPAAVADYVNSEWRIQEQPYRGDVINSYNDGPPAPGAKPMGPFYELETSSPAVPLEPGEEILHQHQTFHITGERAVLSQLAERLLGIPLERID